MVTPGLVGLAWKNREEVKSIDPSGLNHGGKIVIGDWQQRETETLRYHICCVWSF
jgi:hypothetical protein